jgi:predicted permease
MLPVEARRAARLTVGTTSVVEEQVRSYGWEHRLATAAADLRYAARVLRRSPVFTIVTILVIALGTGAVTTIFSGINALVLRPLPGATEPERLELIERRAPDRDEGISASGAYFEFIRANARSLSGVAVWTKAAFVISDGGEGMAAEGNLVSGNYFQVLGVRPALGRFFTPDEDQAPLASPVLVLSHPYWKTRFGGDSTVVGRVVRVNGQPYTIIGVAPGAFRGGFTPITLDAWVPLRMQPHLRPGRDLTHAAWLWMFGRVADGTSRETARRELQLLTARYIAESGEPPARSRYSAVRLTAMTGLPADARGMAFAFLALLMGAAIAVLLIASVNVAAMLSARALTRRREMAVRVALGASRGRLVRQLLTEILLLYAVGAGIGMVLALQATAALEQLPIPSDVPLQLEVSPDLRVFAFALVLSLITGVVFGLAPVMRAINATIATRIREGSTGAGTRRPFMSRAMVAGQLALSLVLLVASGLLLQALGRGARTNPGFGIDGVSTASFGMEALGYDEARGKAFLAAVRERVEAIPGVTGVTFTGNMPLAFATSGARVVVAGQSATTDAASSGDPILMSIVDADYFSVLQMPLVAGRPLVATDNEGTPRVAVVNETFAERYWTDGSALGRSFTYLEQEVTIVGIARDAKYGSLTEVTPAFAYFPIQQSWITSQILLVRSTVPPASLAASIQGAVLAIDPTLPRPVVTTLRESTGIVLLPQRIATIVTAAMGGVGLLLATVGLYGIMSFGVGRRSREIGLRMALGADRRSVLRLIVLEGMRLALVGVAIGVVLSVAATRLLSSLLFGVSPLDPLTFVGMSALFASVALLASYLPARRAAGANPMTVLRVD